jgi:hypothetical protein
MKLTSILACAIVAAGSLAGVAHATPTWTLTTTGTIGSGTDTSGVFGTANADLTGLNYTKTTTVSVDPAQYPNEQIGSDSHNLNGNGGVPAFTTTVTVNGTTVSFNVTNPSYQEHALTNGYSATTNSNDDIYSDAEGSDFSGNNIYTFSELYSDSVDFLPSFDFRQDLTVPVTDGITYFDYFELSGTGAVNFFGDVSTLTLAGGETDVPEPVSIALFGLGLAGMAVLRRRNPV